jgi:hypothetical protein
MNMKSCAALVSATTLTFACNDLSQPWELDHARVIAVRSTPPSIQAGETAQMSALVQNADLTISEISQLTVRVNEPYNQLLAPTTGATLIAADQPTVDQAREILQLAVTDSIIVPVNVVAEIADGGAGLLTFDSVKSVRVGASTVNPSPPGIAIDGALSSGNNVVTMQKGKQHILETVISSAVPNDPVASELTYAWFTTIGELALSEASRSKLTIDNIGAGTILLVARDKQGGIAWSQRPIVVVD